MAKKKITLTDEHILLISHFTFGELPNLEDEDNEYPTYGLDLNSLYGGSYVNEDISYILGKYDEHVPGTEESAEGPRFPEELENHFSELHSYILENLGDIEEIVHQFVGKGGITPGTYVSRNNQHFWTREEN